MRVLLGGAHHRIAKIFSLNGALASLIVLALCLASCVEEDGAAGSSIESATPTATLTIVEPVNGAEIEGDHVRVVGSAPPGAEVRLNVRFGPDESVQVDDSGHWIFEAALDEGKNDFEFFLRDDADTRATLTIIRIGPTVGTELPAETESEAGESPTEATVVITTDDGERIELRSTDQAELVVYAYRLQTVLGPADEALANWREISAEVSAGHVSSSDYYRYLRGAEEAFHSLADRLLTIGVPSEAVRPLAR